MFISSIMILDGGLAYTYRDCRKYILHPLHDLRQALMFEAFAMTHLSLNISSIVSIVDLRI